MALSFADGSQAVQDFTLVAGDPAFIDVSMLDISTKLPQSLDQYPGAIWVLEQVVDEVRKDRSLGQIVQLNDNTLRVELSAQDTEDLHGVYTHQLRVVSTQGEGTTVLLGRVTVKPQVI